MYRNWLWRLVGMDPIGWECGLCDGIGVCVDEPCPAAMEVVFYQQHLKSAQTNEIRS
jgi:hypothetical protein